MITRRSSGDRARANFQTETRGRRKSLHARFRETIYTYIEEVTARRARVEREKKRENRKKGEQGSRSLSLSLVLLCRSRKLPWFLIEGPL